MQQERLNHRNTLKIQAFLKVRPDGVGFSMIARVCAFLEYTRPMDSRDGISEQSDWYTGPTGP